MSDDQKIQSVGPQDLLQFGRYLQSLHSSDRTFELEDSSGELRESSLDEVLTAFEGFCAGGTKRFLVRIHYFDLQAGKMGFTEKEFTRS